MNADALSNRFVHFTAIAAHFKTLTLLRFGGFILVCCFFLFILWVEGLVVVFVEEFVDVGEFVVDFVADLTE